MTHHHICHECASHTAPGCAKGYDDCPVTVQCIGFAPKDKEPSWAVFINRPYYPSLDGLYHTDVEANAAADRLLADEHSEDGQHDATIYVAQVAVKMALKTHY